MRTIIDLPEDDIKMLDHLAKRMDKSRAELVRRSVSAYLKEEIENAKISNDIFGLYDDVFTKDSLDLQENIRNDWGEREENNINWALHEPQQQPYDDGKN